MPGTGANDVPLGSRRRPLGTTSLSDVSQEPSNASSERAVVPRSPPRAYRQATGDSPPRRRSRFDQKSIEDSNSQSSKSEEESKPKKRKSRWNAENQKAFVPGMPTMLPSDLSEEQLKQYLLQLEVEDASRRLRMGDLGLSLNPEERSPSPEPQYDMYGKRLNTREARTRQKLEQQRHKAVMELQKLNPNYKPPPDYRPPSIKVQKKVMIPIEDFPDINFMGLLIGPRGNTLKALEKESGAKIIIRGKGSCKDNMVRGFQMPGMDEPLHAFITGQTEEAVADAESKINELIAQACQAPESYLEMRKIQLRELAMLNGTLRAEDILGSGRCDNCGQTEHKTWECPNAPNVTAKVVCTLCGGAGHIARDCKNPQPGGAAQLDEEYQALMSELGEKSAAPASSAPAGAPLSGQQASSTGAPPPAQFPPHGARVPGVSEAAIRAGVDPHFMQTIRGGRPPVMRVNLAERAPYGHYPPPGARPPRPGAPPPQGAPGYGYGAPTTPWAPPAGGWQMPPGMQANPQWQSPGSAPSGLAPPPPPPTDFSSILAPPPPPEEDK